MNGHRCVLVGLMGVSFTVTVTRDLLAQEPQRAAPDPTMTLLLNGPLAEPFKLFAFGLKARDQNQFAQAEQAFRQSVHAVAGQRFEGQYRKLAQDLLIDSQFALAQVLETLGRHAEAEKEFLANIAFIEKELGAEDLKITASMIDLAAMYSTLRRFDESARFFDRAQAIIEKQPQPNLERLTYVLHGRGVLHAYQQQFDDAQRLYREELELLEKLYGKDHVESAAVLVSLAQTYKAQRRLSDAEPMLERAMAIYVRAYGMENLRVASNQLTLGTVQAEQGRYAEAEAQLKRSLATRERLLGTTHPRVAESLTELASVYLFEARDREALPLLERSIAIEEKTYGPKHPMLINSLIILGQVHRHLDRDDDAAQAYLRLISIMEESKSPDLFQPYQLLAAVRRKQRRLDEAEKLCLDALKINEARSKGRPDRRIIKWRAVTYDGLALVYNDQGRKQEAIECYDKSLALHEEAGSAPGELAALLVKRAEVIYELGRVADALPDVRRAVELAEQQRTTYSGGDIERATSFGHYSVIYEYMVRLQERLGGIAEAFDAMERVQARALADQMAVQGVDLLQGVPSDEAESLRRRLDDSSRRLAEAEGQLQALDGQQQLTNDQRGARQRALVSAANQARGDYAAAQADLRNVSPAFRLAVGKDQKMVTLDQLQQYVAKEHGLLLRYLTGHAASFALAVPAEGPPKLYSLVINDLQAKRLGVAAGPLTIRKLGALLANEGGTGVLQLLRSADKAGTARKVVEPLAALWEVLIPEPHRQSIIDGTCQKLMVVPDGALAMLPYEALVVESGDDPRYLLDVGPPLLYAPSATMLENLSRREPAPEKSVGGAVLCVGDPAYDQSAPETAAAGAQLAARARYRSAGGHLSRLPYSALETTWIEQVFQKQKVGVQKLLGPTATEANVRQRLPGSRIVHLACHGLSDQEYGNLFGALALTPMRSRTLETANDGYLTLGEIYGLDAHACELAILSACDTNYGPNQHGEGVWALSRGFLVAGARRVVASNWYVDDQAAASLMSYFAGGIALATGRGEPANYAVNLHTAKKWVRKQEKWSSPYYWATFVLVGPN
jgi:CHAT domain-containing protein/tetratricopeptide (TPR) repeat protein